MRMFQFSNLLNRSDSELRRRHPSIGINQASLAASGTTEDGIPTGAPNDSLPERVRRELDEQMERLTKLLDHVESLESERRASGAPYERDIPKSFDTSPVSQIFRDDAVETEPPLSHGPRDAVKLHESAVPEDIDHLEPRADDLRPSLHAAVFDLGTEVVSELVFGASSADAVMTGAECASISVHTEEVVPFPKLRHQEQSGTDRRARPPHEVVPTIAKAAPAVEIRRKHYTQKAAKPRRNRPCALEPPPDTLLLRRGVVQDFAGPDTVIHDELPTLEIFEPEPDSACGANACHLESLDADEPPPSEGPPSTRLCLNLSSIEECRDASHAEWDQKEYTLAAADEPIRTPRTELRLNNEPPEGVVAPSLSFPSLTPERVAADMQCARLVVEAPISDSAISQTISVAPPRSDVVLLKSVDCGRAADARIPNSQTAEVPRAHVSHNAPHAAPAAPAAANAYAEPLASKPNDSMAAHATARATESLQPIAGPDGRNERPESMSFINAPQIPITTPFHPDNATIPTPCNKTNVAITPAVVHATGTQLLNVLAVLGGVLTLAALAFVATDLASWF